MKTNSKVLVKNTIMMYLLSIAKLVIPLISLPYLTRVLSVNTYGSISFAKNIISYMQILIDFGFLLSATKDIVIAIKGGDDSEKIIGDTLYAQLLLCFIAFVITLVCCFSFKILRGYELFTIISLIPAILTIFLFEYVFKAYEQMEKIAIRFIIMKVIALILTLIFVKNDSHIYLIPLFDIIASIVAVVLVFVQFKKMNIKLKFNFKRIKSALNNLKNSFIYFVSNFATTAFSLLNTLIIGIMLTKADVAYWNVSMQLVAAVQALYTPITTSVFPSMVKNKNLKLIKKIMLIYMPLILLGCGLIVLLGDWVVGIVFTEKYIMSSTILKWLLPVLIFSFPALLYGWPCLGAIDKQKANSLTTIISAVVQVVGLVILILIGKFTILGLCIVRNVTEITLCVSRMVVVYKNKNKFTNQQQELKDFAKNGPCSKC